MTFTIPLVIVVGILAWVLRPGKNSTTACTAAILVTVIPPVVLAIAAIVFQLVHNAAGKTWVSDISNVCFIVGLGLIGAAILASVGFTFMRKGEVAKGIGFGICIAVFVSIMELILLEGLAGV